MPDMLTQTENAKLRKHEDVIQRGKGTFIEVGNALLAIHDERLYRQEYATFEEYCAKRWEFTKRHAYRLIESAAVVENLSPKQTKQTSRLEVCPIGHTEETPLPSTESQAREVAKAPPEKQPEVWKEAVETAPKGKDGTPKVTAQHVRQTRERVAPSPAKPRTKPSTNGRRAPTKAEIFKPLVDAIGAAARACDTVAKNTGGQGVHHKATLGHLSKALEAAKAWKGDV